MKFLLLVALGSGISLLLAGCETTGTSGTTPDPSAAPARAAGTRGAETVLIPAGKVNAVTKGMAAAEVRQLLGAPAEVRPFPSAEVKAEVWVYRISSRDTVNSVPVAMQDVTSIDPLSGHTVTLKEPVYQNQRVQIYQTLELLMIGGRVMERKGGREVDRSYQ